MAFTIAKSTRKCSKSRKEHKRKVATLYYTDLLARDCHRGSLLHYTSLHDHTNHNRATGVEDVLRQNS